MDKKKKAELKASKGKHAAGAQSDEVAGSAVQATGKADGRPASSGKTLQQDPIPASETPLPPAPFEPTAFPDGERSVSKRKHPVLRGLGIVFACLIGLAAIAYGAGCVYFMDRFFPNTVMGSYDVSLKSSDEAREILQEGIQRYRLDVAGQGLKFAVASADAQLVLDADAVLANALGESKPWMWPFELQNAHDVSSHLKASCSKDVLAGIVQEQVEAFNGEATGPTDATVAFDAERNAYQVVPEALGTALDADAVAAAIGEALESLEPKVEITASALLKPPVLADDPALAAARDAANGLLTADFTLMMGSSEAAEVGPELLSSWIVFDENRVPSFDEGLMNAWIETFAASCNTVGTERSYTREDGKAVTVAGGSYGWTVDQAALIALLRDSIAAGQTGTVEAPVVQGAAVYAGAGQRDWGRYVDVDLSEQYVRFYGDDGTVLWESPTITGKPVAGLATPTGVYYVTTKGSPVTLHTFEPGKKEPEKTVVQYWMPFVGNVVGLHDAWWQPGFGGTMYRDGYGSHGCVNLPSAKAQELYGILGIGDVVVVHW